MKTMIAILICLLSGSVAINAQSGDQTSALLFENFTQGTVRFKNKPATQAMLNYDMLKQEMLFLDGSNQMILQELHTIDTIYVDGRKFVPQRNVFIEKLNIGSQVVYIEWKMNAFTKLKEEGMGIVSQGGGTEALNVSRTQSGETGTTRNITYDYKYNNSYYLLSGKKMQKFSTIQGFLKLYPKEHAKEIQEYVSEHKINIQNIENLVMLIEYAAKFKN